MAGEVTILGRGRDPGSRLFQKIKTRHVVGLGTTQGTYIITPAGRLLTSNHNLEPLGLQRFLRRGLKKWQRLSTKERLGTPSRSQARTGTRSEYPKGGLVLRAVLRKFPRRNPVRRRGFVTWNQDFAWFRKAEAAGFLPKNPGVGDRYAVPDALVHRLARNHLTDTVRAYADPYSRRHIEKANLTSTVVKRDGSLVELRLEGVVRMSQTDRPRFAPRQRLARRPERGYDAALLGYATFDMKTRAFVRFELVAYGDHRGGGQRSGTEPVPMGVAFSIVEPTPMNRVEPMNLRYYDWD